MGKSSHFENVGGGCTFMAIFCGVVFLNLYLFFASPPWMEDINHFFGGGKVNFQILMYISIGNAFFTAFMWWLALKVCKHMVSKPLEAAGFSNFILTLHGSWVFILLFTSLPAISSLFLSLLGITNGITQEYPLFLLNLLSPVATIAVLTIAFPSEKTMEKAFSVIAPDPPEPPETGESGQ